VDLRPEKQPVAQISRVEIVAWGKNIRVEVRIGNSDSDWSDSILCGTTDVQMKGRAFVLCKTETDNYVEGRYVFVIARPQDELPNKPKGILNVEPELRDHVGNWSHYRPRPTAMVYDRKFKKTRQQVARREYYGTIYQKDYESFGQQCGACVPVTTPQQCCRAEKNLNEDGKEVLEWPESCKLRCETGFQKSASGEYASSGMEYIYAKRKDNKAQPCSKNQTKTTAVCDVMKIQSSSCYVRSSDKKRVCPPVCKQGWNHDNRHCYMRPGKAYSDTVKASTTMLGESELVARRRKKGSSSASTSRWADPNRPSCSGNIVPNHNGGVRYCDNYPPTVCSPDTPLTDLCIEPPVLHLCEVKAWGQYEDVAIRPLKCDSTCTPELIGF
jgi:hypothetical protein